MGERGNKTLRFFDKYLGIPVVRILGVTKKRKSVLDNYTIKRVGLLKTAGIGDTVLLSGIIQDLKSSIPDVSITIFTGENNFEMAKILAEFYKIEVIKLPVKNPVKAIKIIKNFQFDVFFDFGQWSRLEAFFSYFANALLKVGFKTPGQYRHFVYDISVLHRNNVHEIDNYRALLKAVGITGKAQPRLPIEPSQKRKVVVVHMFPGGVKSYLKEWPPEYWIRVVNYITEKGYRVLLTGGKSDRERALELKKKCQRSELIEVGAGKLSLKDTINRLSESMLLITVNTGIMHIASAIGLNMIALHGPTSVKRWGPLNKNAISIQSPLSCSPCLNLGFEYGCNENKCMRAIKPETVILYLNRFLQV